MNFAASEVADHSDFEVNAGVKKFEDHVDGVG